MKGRTWLGLLAAVLVGLFVAHTLRYEPLRTTADGSRVVTLIWDRWTHRRCVTVYFLGTDSYPDAARPQGRGGSVPSELTLDRCY